MRALALTITLGVTLLGAPVSFSSEPAASLVDQANAAVRLGDYERAAKLWEQLAKSGDAEGQYRLGTLHRSGRGVPRSRSHAKKWFGRAAQSGHASAQHALAQLLEADATEVPQREQAISWYRRAAKQGHSAAAKRLESLDRSAGAANGSRRGSSGPAGPPSSLLAAAARGQREDVARALALAAGSGAELEQRDPYGDSPLLLAVRRGKPDIVEILLKAGADPEGVDGQGRTPLMIAASKGHGETVRLLAAGGASLSARDPKQRGALEYAIAAQQAETARQLRRLGARPARPASGTPAASAKAEAQWIGRVARGSHSQGRQIPPLVEAAWRGRLSVVTALLETRAPIEEVDSAGCGALHRAAEVGHTKVVAVLIEHGANVNAVDSAGLTPLMVAVAGGHLDSARLLLESGAQVNHRDENGGTALSAAVRENRVAAVALLLEAGGDRNDDPSGNSDLFSLAAKLGHREVLHELLAPRDSGAPELPRARSRAACAALEAGHVPIAVDLSRTSLQADEVCGDGVPLLGHAAETDDAQLIESLIEKGADPNRRSKGENTPLHLAAREGSREGVRVLLENGADVDARGHGKMTPLMYAALGGHDEVVRSLLAAGARVKARNSAGDTAAKLADRAGNRSTSEILTEGESRGRLFGGF